MQNSLPAPCYVFLGKMLIFHPIFMGIPRSTQSSLTLFQLCCTNLTAEKGEKAKSTCSLLNSARAHLRII